MDVERVAARIVLARRGLGEYIRVVHGWEVRPHQEGWVRALEALVTAPGCWGGEHPVCECGDEHVCDACFECRVYQEKRLLIVAPPGWGKTDTLIEFMGWCIGRDAEGSALGFFSYNDNIATERAMAVRDTLWSKEPSEVAARFQLVFPGVRPAPERPWSQERFFLWRRDSSRKDPSLVAAGITGSVNARRLTGLVFDDPHNQENSGTPYQRAEVWKGYKRAAETRLLADGWQAGITTRWAEDDWGGRAMELGWPYLHTRALENERSTWEYEGPNLGFRTEKLLRLREEDPISFSLQYQGEVISEESATLVRPREMHSTEFPASFRQVFQSWDTAVGKERQHSESCCTTWGVAEDAIYWLDTWTGQLAYTELAEQMMSHYWEWRSRHSVSPVLVEQASSGDALIHMFRAARTPAGQLLNLPVLPVPVGGRGKTKEGRIAAAARILSTRVVMPSDATWRPKAISQLLSYRGGGKFRGRDDIVMSMTQALNYLDVAPDYSYKMDIRVSGWN